MTMLAERTRAGLTTFLVLTFGLSAIFYALIISAGSLGAHGGLYVLALMWSPGVSALITRLVFQHNVRGCRGDGVVLLACAGCRGARGG